MKRQMGLFGIVIVSLLVLSVSVHPLMAQKVELQPGLAMVVLETRVFAEADLGSDKLATLEPGELVIVLEVDGEWARFEYENIVGWAKHSFAATRLIVNVDGPTPPPRGYHRMTYDVESDRVILFGGLLVGGAEYNDTWSYDLGANAWVRMAPVQSPPINQGTLAYDVQLDRAILFCSPLENLQPTGGPSETWAYDYNTDTWTNLEPSPAPPQLIGARIVYDEESDRMILFGGMDPTQNWYYTNETWAYDYDANTWTQMDPEVRPPGVNFQPMAYDAGADRVIMIGSNAFEVTDNTWVYDYNTDTWEERETADSPKHRDYSAMVYAAGVGQVILFGEGEPITKNDTWAYDYSSNSWTQLEPDGPPSKRGWHAMVYSTAADQIVLFGGGRSRQSPTFETWFYDPGANTWTQVGP